MPENDYYRHGPHAIERREPLVSRFYDEVARAEADIRAERAARADKLSSIAVTLSSLCVDTDVVVDVLRMLSEEARKSRMVHTNDLDALDEALGYIGGVGQEPAEQSEGMASATRINAAMEVREITGEEAAEAISDFAGLELVPITEDADRAKLRRAGLVVDQPSARQVLRDELKGVA